MGKQPIYVYFILTIVGLAAVAGVYFMWSEQSALRQQRAVTGEDTEAGALPLLGKAATLSTNVYDRSADDVSGRVNKVPIYIWDTNTGRFIEDGLESSSSARKDSSTKVGIRINAVAFNATATLNTAGWYGEPLVALGEQGELLEAEQAELDLDVYTIVRPADNSGLQLILFNDSDSNSGGTMNLTGQGAGSTATLNKLRIKLNRSNCAFRIGGLYMANVEGRNNVDKAHTTVEDSNVSEITIGSGIVSYQDTTTRDKFGILGPANQGTLTISAAGSGLKRTNLDEFIFTIEPAVLLLEYDYIDTGQIAVTLDGSGAGNEVIQITVFDKAYYRSARSEGLGYGYETDAVAAEDVGGYDHNTSFDISG